MEMTPVCPHCGMSTWMGSYCANPFCDYYIEENGGKLLPTPTGQDQKQSGGSTEKNVTLTDAVIRTDLGKKENKRHAPRDVDESGPSE